MTSRAGNRNYGKGLDLHPRRYGFTNRMKASKYVTLYTMNPITKKRIWKAVRLGFKEMHLVGEGIEVTRDKAPVGTCIFTARMPRKSWSIYVKMEWDYKTGRAVLTGLDGVVPMGRDWPRVELDFEDYEDVPEITLNWLKNPRF